MYNRKKKYEKERYKDELESYGFMRDEDIPLSETDKEYYYWGHRYVKKKILDIVTITDKAVLFQFNNYKAWFPKSVLFTHNIDEYLKDVKNSKTIEYKKYFKLNKIEEEVYGSKQERREVYYNEEKREWVLK